MPTFPCPNCLQRGRVRPMMAGAFGVYFCDVCDNGFTFPVPKTIEKYYHNRYWTSSNWLGQVKDFIFDVFQKRRAHWVINSIPKGNILDVGAGEGKFAESLPLRYKVTSLESPWAKIKNKRVIKEDFLKWETRQKFDAVCFWESLEHTPYPQKYLGKAHQLLKRGGKIFIEFPRFSCLESRLFGKNWFHLDLPRHLVHLTDKGLILLLKRSGFKNTAIKNVMSFDYAPWGLTTSFVNQFSQGATDDIKKSKKPLILVLFLPLAFFSTILEIGLFLMNQSPIGLATASRK